MIDSTTVNAPYSIADWAKIDQYHNSFLIAEDEVLDLAVKNCSDHGLPCIAVSPSQGKLLNLVAQSIGAKRILEVGTLGGYVWYLTRFQNFIVRLTPI